MPRWNAKLDDGRTVVLESETQPTADDVLSAVKEFETASAKTSTATATTTPKKGAVAPDWPQQEDAPDDAPATAAPAGAPAAGAQLAPGWKPKLDASQMLTGPGGQKRESGMESGTGLTAAVGQSAVDNVIAPLTDHAAKSWEAGAGWTDPLAVAETFAKPAVQAAGRAFSKAGEATIGMVEDLLNGPQFNPKTGKFETAIIPYNLVSQDYDTPSYWTGQKSPHLKTIEAIEESGFKWTGAAARTGRGLVESAPKMAAQAALGPVAGPAVWGVSEEGFDPVAAGTMYVLPLAKTYGGEVAENVARKLGISNDNAATLVNRTAGAATAAGLISADSIIKLAGMTEAERKKAAPEIIGTGIAIFALSYQWEGQARNAEKAYSDFKEQGRTTVDSDALAQKEFGNIRSGKATPEAKAFWNRVDPATYGTTRENVLAYAKSIGMNETYLWDYKTPEVVPDPGLTAAAQATEKVAPATSAALKQQDAQVPTTATAPNTTTGTVLKTPEGAKPHPQQALLDDLIQEGVKRSDAEALISGTKTVKQVVDENLNMVAPSRDFSELAANPDSSFGHADAMEEGYRNAIARLSQILDLHAPVAPKAPVVAESAPTVAQTATVESGTDWTRPEPLKTGERRKLFQRAWDKANTITDSQERAAAFKKLEQLEKDHEQARNELKEPGLPIYDQIAYAEDLVGFENRVRRILGEPEIETQRPITEADQAKSDAWFKRRVSEIEQKLKSGEPITDSDRQDWRIGGRDGKELPERVEAPKPDPKAATPAPAAPAATASSKPSEATTAQQIAKMPLAEFSAWDKAQGANRQQARLAVGMATPPDVLKDLAEDADRQAELAKDQANTADPEERQAAINDLMAHTQRGQFFREALLEAQRAFDPETTGPITAAAWQDPATKEVHTGANHPEILTGLGKPVPSREARNTPEYGYQTANVPFVPRSHAGPIAEAHNQKLETFDEGDTQPYADQIAATPGGSTPLAESKPDDARVSKAAQIMSDNLTRRIKNERLYKEATPERQQAMLAEHSPERKAAESQKMLAAIDAKDAHYFIERNNGMWPSMWKAFSAETGVVMPTTQKGISDTIRQWVGPEKYDAAMAERKASQDAKSAKYEDEARKRQEDRVLGEKVGWRMGTDTPAKYGTLREKIDDLVANGFTRLSEVKRGAFPVLRMMNASNGFFDIRQKIAADYARRKVAESADKAGEGKLESSSGLTVSPTKDRLIEHSSVPIGFIDSSQKFRDSAIVEKYRQQIRNGETPEPIHVILNHQTGRFSVTDGHHRYEAYKAEGIKNIPVVEIVRPYEIQYEVGEGVRDVGSAGHAAGLTRREGPKIGRTPGPSTEEKGRSRPNTVAAGQVRGDQPSVGRSYSIDEFPSPEAYGRWVQRGRPVLPTGEPDIGDEGRVAAAIPGSPPTPAEAGSTPGGGSIPKPAAPERRGGGVRSNEPESPPAEGMAGPGSREKGPGMVGLGGGAGEAAGTENEFSPATIGDLIDPSLRQQFSKFGPAKTEATFGHETQGFLSKMADFFANSKTSNISESLKGWLGEMAGKTMPRTTLKDRLSGELAGRWVASRAAAGPMGNVFVNDVLAGLPVDPAEFHAALIADNLISIQEAFTAEAERLHDEAEEEGLPEKIDQAVALEDAATNVNTMLGSKDFPFKDEEELRQYFARPEISEAIRRHQDNWAATVEPLYRTTQNIDPEVELPTRGKYSQARINLNPIVEGEYKPEGKIVGGSYGTLTGTLRRMNPFARKAMGTGQAYALNYAESIANSFARQLEIANKKAFEDRLIQTGNAVIDDAGRHPKLADGEVTKGYPLLRKRYQNKAIYVRASLAREYEIAANVVLNPYRGTLLYGIAKVLNNAALAGLTDATVHVENLATAAFQVPGTTGTPLLIESLLSAAGRMDIPVTAARGALKALPHTHLAGWLAQHGPQGISDAINRALLKHMTDLASIAQINASRVPHVGSVLGLKFLGRGVLKADQVTRMVLNDAFTNLAKQGLVRLTETNRREFINQAGNYNLRSQGPWMRFLRQTLLAPFATAARNFATLGIRGLTLNPGVEASSIKASAALRANMLSKWIGSAVFVALMNYLIVRKIMGRPGTRFGSIDTGKDDARGNPKSFDVLAFTGQSRALRTVGARSAIDALRHGLTKNDAASSAIRDVANTASALVTGPAPRFGFEALTGYPPAIGVGRSSRVVPPGENQYVENVKSAAMQANPIAASIQEATNTGGSIGQGLARQMPRFTLQTGKQPDFVANYPKIVRMAQSKQFVEDVIGQARKLPMSERYKFVQSQLKRLPYSERYFAEQEVQRRAVYKYQ